MELKEGKKYRQRNGEIVGPLEPIKFPFVAYKFYCDRVQRSWTIEGCFYNPKRKDKNDLIEEVLDGDN